VVRHGNELQNKYKVLFVGFDAERCQDIMYEADFSINYFDSKYIMPSMLKFVGQDYEMGYSKS